MARSDRRPDSLAIALREERVRRGIFIVDAAEMARVSVEKWHQAEDGSIVGALDLFFEALEGDDNGEEQLA